MLWCIACQQEVLNPIHVAKILLYPDEPDMDWCDGNGGDSICSCPPPPYPEHWEDFVQEPESEFMALMETLI